MATQPTAILKGTLYLKKLGGTQLLPSGNATKITLAHEIEEITLPDAQNPGGGNHDSFKRVKAVKLQVSFRNMPLQVLEIVFGGKITAVAGGAITDEAHNDIKLGSLVRTVKINDLSAALTVKKAAATLVEGTDYKRTRAGIIPLTGGALIDDDDVLISYTAVASQRVDGLKYTSGEFYGLFDGINGRSGDPLVGDLYRLVFGPAQSVELVGEGNQFASFDCEAELLADESKPATDSQFYHFHFGNIAAA